MAMRYSKTNPELMEKWLASSQRAYALPKVNLQYDKQLDEGTRYDYVVGSTGDLESQVDYVQIGNDDRVVVKLEWRLDKLVMSSEQIRVINETGKANKMREKVLDEVTRLYFDRRRLQVDNLLNPPSSLPDQIEMELRLQEMTANLDALTGGEFSAKFYLTISYIEHSLRRSECLIKESSFWILAHSLPNLIARRIREMNVYCEIHPCTEPFHEDWTYDGIILSGGPASVLGDEAPDVDERWLQTHSVTLGVCYGMQMMAQRTGCQLGAWTKTRVRSIDVVHRKGAPFVTGLPTNSIGLDESWRSC